MISMYIASNRQYGIHVAEWFMISDKLGQALIDGHEKWHIIKFR